MKTAKRICALALSIVMAALMLTGCHSKGEIAVTVGDWDFTSGYYACAFVMADMEARSLVEEELSEEGDLPDDINYSKYEVEDTDYSEWVRNTAIVNLKTVAAYKTLCVENEIVLDAETEELSDSYSEYLWDTYGYSALFEENGVNKATFYQYNKDSYYAEEYFNFLYGEGGEKEVSAQELSDELGAHYILANVLEVDFSDLEEDEIAAKTEQFEQFEKDLSSGKKTFEDVYLEYNEISAEEHTHEEAEEGELSPQDHHATILGDDDTSYASDNYETAKDMAVGEVKLVTLDDEAGLVLIVKQDIVADPYYVDYLDVTLRDAVAGEEFEEEIADYAEKLEAEENQFAIKQFKVKNIVYPEY